MSKKKRAYLTLLAVVSAGVLPETGCVADQVLQTISLAFRIAGVWT